MEFERAIIEFKEGSKIKRKFWICWVDKNEEKLRVFRDDLLATDWIVKDKYGNIYE